MSDNVVTWEEAVRGVTQGFPGAMQVLYSLRETMPDEYPRLLAYLYEHGPRGPGLYARYDERCGQDALQLGRDLLAQVSELEGWDG